MPAGAVGRRRLLRPKEPPETVAAIAAAVGGAGQRLQQLRPGQTVVAAAASDGADWIGFRRSLVVVFSVDYLELWNMEEKGNGKNSMISCVLL